eukprot:COSAG02_NODE_1057_length_14906_cov_79.739853_2_plen_73_part_00
MGPRRTTSREEEDECGLGFVQPLDAEAQVNEHNGHGRGPRNSDQIAVGLGVIILFQHTVSSPVVQRAASRML